MAERRGLGYAACARVAPCPPPLRLALIPALGIDYALGIQ